MSVSDAMTRIVQIQSLLDPVAVPATPSTTATRASTATTALPTSSTFASLLSGAQSQAGLTTSALMAPTTIGAPGGTVGQQMVQLAAAELGQAEAPPGSNDSPRIAEYRTATSGSGVGPWCAYFTSWVARQAGAPIGEAGQGFGAVESVAAWGQRTGRYYEAGTQTPQPGDLIIWGGRHIGIVESVGVDGSVNTIEGNSSDRVSRRSYGSDGGGATGYVRLG